MKDGIYKVAAATPHIRVGDCKGNADKIIELIDRAERAGASLLVLPELCVTGYTAGDLFLLDSLIGGAEEAVDRITDSTEGKDVVTVFGAPAMMRGKLYSAAFVVQRGRVLGVVPKKHIPNYSEFYEARMFTAFTGENDVLDTYAIEKQMETVKREIDGNIELLERTEGDKGRIEKIIERQTNELAALREQLKLVQAKIESNQSVNTEVERIKKLLTDDSLNFDVYDDRTVRLLIEYIRVMEEGKIVIMLKGGITIEERVE